MTRHRPKNLNLLTIRLPLPALVSILHRISGAVMFLAIPILLWMLQQSLANAQGYASAQRMLHHPLMIGLSLLLIWTFCFHACAGLRHLMLEARWGVNLAFGRLSSYAVFLLSIVMTLLIGMWLW